jgi:hypothetical protein
MPIYSCFPLQLPYSQIFIYDLSANQQPYMIQFQSDAFTQSDAMVARKGFKLAYWQTTTC